MRGSKLAASLAVLLAGSAPGVQQAPPPGLVRAGEYRVGQPAPPVAVSGGLYDVGAFPLSTPELPPGEGRDATVAMCSVCHSVRYITMQPPLPPATWAATVRKMIDVHGAAIPEDVAGRITGYLQARYGVR
jgi:hypothetical protein